MKLLKTLLRIFLYLIVLGFLAGWIYIRYISYRPVPNYGKDISLKRLSRAVSVYRDSMGIPHLYAKNETDLYRVTGYLEAQDRMWQMDLLRRVTQGRLSEIFGEDFVQTDLLLRALRIPEKSLRIKDSLSSGQLETLQAFADGVNQYIEKHHNSLPVEFKLLGYKPEPWKPEHSLNIIGYMSWDLANGTYSTEVLLYKISKKVNEEKSGFLLPEKKRKQIFVYPSFTIDTSLLAIQDNLLSGNGKLAELGLHIFSGSNNWAVSSEKSVSGHAMLSNDMHLSLNMPGIWYQMHQAIDGKLNVTGVVIPGEPLIVAGHNEDIAWGMTNMYVDDIDIYHERLNPENPDQYRFDGKWHPLEVRKEIIRIKGGKEITDTLKFTHHGPIISRFKHVNETLSMRWVGNDYSNEYLGVYALNRAKNWNDFREGIRHFKCVSQNFIFADKSGNIGLYSGGGVPIRKGPGYMIRPGDTSLYDWTGKVPFSLLPHTYNPPEHQVSSANNKTINNDYTYYIGTYFAQYYRISRIREMLNAREKLTRQDFEKMQADQHSKLAENIVPELVHVLNAARSSLSPVELQALEILRNWDGDMTADSPAPTIFDVFYKKFLEETVQDELGPELTKEFLQNSKLYRNLFENIWYRPTTDWLDDTRTNNIHEIFAEITVRSFSATVKEITDRYGSKPAFWTWGKVHQLTLQHPMGKVKLLNRIFHLNRGPFPVGGSFHTVCPYSYPLTDPFVVNHAASQRHIYIAGEWDQSETVIPTGESGVPASDFYGDQTSLYVRNKYHRDYFSKNLVIKNAKYSMSFTPIKKFR